MEVFEGGHIPFGSVWEDFRMQFRARFETANEMVDAKDKLRLLWQGQTTVPEYAAQFKQVMGRTGYSVADLQDRFYEHLAPRIKDELVHTARPIGTLDELINVASDIDARVRQRRTEKEREKRRSELNTGTTTVSQPLSNKPFLAPTADPTAMDVDAMHTREEFLRRMRGKCFGCGSTTHTRKDGNHEHEICKFCQHVGHREPVCMDKFLGKPKGQKAAMTMEEEDPYEEDMSEEEPEELEEAQAAATSDDALAQLLEQQKALTEEIAKWREEGF
jgi:Retrotransposon gag protein